MDLDDELIDSIAPNVLKVLASKGFFEALDDQLCRKRPVNTVFRVRGHFVHP